MSPARRQHVPWQALVLPAMLGAACNLDNPGEAPPPGTLYFPTALALTKPVDGRSGFLLVANSNFDLRYNAGSVMAIDLDEVAEAIDACDGDEPCEIDTEQVLEDEKLIGSFATALAVSSDGERLYVPTRTESTLTFARIEESGSSLRLDCGRGRSCDSEFKRGDDSVQSERRISFPSDPVAVLAGSLSDWLDEGGQPIDPDDVDGDYIIVAHRRGQVSLFVEQREGTGLAPNLVHTRSGLPRDLTSLAFDPDTHLAYVTSYQATAQSPGGAKQLSRIGVIVDRGKPSLSYMYDADPVELQGVEQRRDTRAVKFIERDEAASRPLARAVVVSRDPSALLTVDVSEARNPLGEARVDRITEVGIGPSRLTLGEVNGMELAVVSCFDSREIFIIDLASGLARSVVPNLSGPFELVLDSFRQRIYVADFRSSVIRVLDVAPVADLSRPTPTTASVVGTIGTPRLVQELQ